MHSLGKFILSIFLAAALCCLPCQTAFALSESDVQAQVDAAGKEAVSGNVFIWFLCAIAFLKVSQKIDSFMSSLGVNVGHTGGSMLAEAMLAARGMGTIRNASAASFGGKLGSGWLGGGSAYANPNGGRPGGFMAGGLAGIASRKITANAMKAATSPPGGQASSGGIGGHIYASSASKGGEFANHVIGSIATGSLASNGSITGDKAAEALHSYMGHAKSI